MLVRHPINTWLYTRLFFIFYTRTLFLISLSFFQILYFPAVNSIFFSFSVPLSFCFSLSGVASFGKLLFIPCSPWILLDFSRVFPSCLISARTFGFFKFLFSYLPCFCCVFRTHPVRLHLICFPRVTCDDFVFFSVSQPTSESENLSLGLKNQHDVPMSLGRSKGDTQTHRHTQQQH